MKEKKLFSWEIPENIYANGEIKCDRQLGGCGRWHEFTVDERAELEFNASWENSKGEFECEKFADWLEAEAREEWAEEFKNKFLKEQEESERLAEQKRTKAKQVEHLRIGVKLDERQFEREWGAVRPVGFYRRRQGVFVCGNCSVELKGAGRHDIARNRNNPLFWGLEVAEKILCLACVKSKYYAVMSYERKKVLRKYLKRGYK